MIDRYRRNISAIVRQLAKDDPDLVIEFIEQLKASSEIEPDDLQHIERIARKWMQINQENLKKARR